MRKRLYTGRLFKGRLFAGRLFNVGVDVIVPGSTVGGGGPLGYAERPERGWHYDDWKARQQDTELLELAIIITRAIT